MVVVEPAMTETAAVADYVLPAAVGYEKWEWVGFAKGHFPEIATQLRPPVVPPPGEALPEPEICARLAEAAGIFGDPPHELHALADAANLGIDTGQKVALQTRRGALEWEAEIDEKLLAGHVWAPNGFGVVYPDPETNQPAMQGVNLNEITGAQDRDPISGCPHHKVIPCRVKPLAVAAAG